MKSYQDSIIDLTKKFSVNDCIELSIHTVDRTNTDVKYMPCLIIENSKNLLYRLVCQYGELQDTSY